MTTKSHFQLMAKYNQRMNAQLYEQASTLSDAQLSQNTGAFFGSLIGTLNHILVGDLFWLGRFRTHSDQYFSLAALEQFPRPTALNQILYADIEKFYEARVKLDAVIIEWLDETDDGDFQRNFAYQSTQGKPFNKNFGEVLSHVFNHQTHHRGQASTLLCQYGRDIGATDFILDIPDQ